jgi:sarcosine oxidase subunit gamma
MDKLIARTTVSPNFFGEGVFPIRSRSLQVSELALAGIIRIQGKMNDESFRSGVAAALSVQLPAPERVVKTNGVRLAWAGPNECLCFCALENEKEFESLLVASLAGQFATITLVSDSRVAFLISGSEAAALLAADAPLRVRQSHCPPAPNKSNGRSAWSLLLVVSPSTRRPAIRAMRTTTRIAAPQR